MNLTKVLEKFKPNIFGLSFFKNFFAGMMRRDQRVGAVCFCLF